MKSKQMECPLSEELQKRLEIKLASKVFAPANKLCRKIIIDNILKNLENV